MSRGFPGAEVSTGDKLRCGVVGSVSLWDDCWIVQENRRTNAALALAHQGEALSLSTAVARPFRVRASDGGSEGKRGAV
jgi:hypothetical protein